MERTKADGLRELREARAESRGLLAFVGIFSVFVNALMLTGPLYMLQVYDRVLGSRSVATLVALSVIVAFLYLTMGILDYIRGRVMARIGARFQAKLDRREHPAALEDAASKDRGAAAAGVRDLETVQRFLASPILGSLFDLPFTPVFLAGIFFFHPWLGYMAMGGGGILILLTFLNQRATKAPQLAASQAAATADMMSERLKGDAGMVQALGMRGAAFTRWHQIRGKSLGLSLNATDAAGSYTAMTKTFRMFLQSAMLGMGAYLVLQGDMTSGAMIAGSILLGRALAPIEQLIGGWGLVVRARQGWGALNESLARAPAEAMPTRLPVPRARLQLTGVSVVPPDQQRPSPRGG